MAQLQYGQFLIRPSELRTMECSVSPVMDYSGREVLYYRLLLRVQAVVHPLMMATSQPATFIAPGPFSRPPDYRNPQESGDPAGLTMRNLAMQMGAPRQLLRYWINQDLVVESPQRLDPNGNTFLPCDPMGGPYVHYCRVFEVQGDKLAILHFAVETAITPCNKILLSNRWSMTSETDGRGFTTRIIQGQARFRLDYLIQENFTPDEARNLLMVPADGALKRERVNVTAGETGQDCPAVPSRSR
jgi:hypothetical protein